MRFQSVSPLFTASAVECLGHKLAISLVTTCLPADSFRNATTVRRLQTDIEKVWAD